MYVKQNKIVKGVWNEKKNVSQSKSMLDDENQNN